VTLKLVRGDYKSKIVTDPRQVNPSHVKKIKKYVKDFMEKAVQKKEDRRKAKAAQKAQNNDCLSPATPADANDAEVEWTDDMLNAASPSESNPDLKRKREEEGSSTSPKRSRTGEEIAPTPPPPPPVSNAVEETAGSPMDDASAMSFPEVVEARGKQLDGYGSPMQMATPSTNGSGERTGSGGGRR
jgi:hypothetical protein